MILNELECENGLVKVDGQISYASQEPWLFPVSVKSNIIFGQEEDMDRYQKVINSCALSEDFKQLRCGDATLVGEGGASLSGGQKARVNLARAVYNDKASIYLFDDPLSAVDARVGREIFNNVMGPNSLLLRNKTRILITHQIQYLDQADYIVLVEDGKITATGSFEEMRGRLSDCNWGSSDVDSVAEVKPTKDEELTSNAKQPMQNGCSKSVCIQAKHTFDLTMKCDFLFTANQSEHRDRPSGSRRPG